MSNKERIFGKTVYIFGAGASYHVGAPLLKDFLVIARSLYGRGVIHENLKSFEMVFNWIESLKGASYYVDVDLDNIEHVFSLAEMQSQLGVESGHSLYDALTNVITNTLDQSIKLNIREKKIHLDNMYASFGVKLRAYKNSRQSRDAVQFEDSLVSFNYDPVLDFSIGDSLGVNYCLEGENRDGIKLLKLHGSTTWGVCSSCKSRERRIQSVVIKQSDLYEWLRPGPLMHLSDGTVPFSIQKKIMKRWNCRYCQKSEFLKPFLIPPTWSKRIADRSLQAVWGQVVKELQSAYQLVVIGYSMPQTDTFFQYLLTLGLQKNSNLNRIVIVNPDKNPDTEARYRHVFSRSMTDRGRIFYERITFEDFMSKKIDEFQEL